MMQSSVFSKELIGCLQLEATHAIAFFNQLKVKLKVKKCRDFEKQFWVAGFEPETPTPVQLLPEFVFLRL